MDFVTRLSVSTNQKGNTYNLILVIIDWLTKMIHYKPVKVTIDTLGLVEVILDMVVQYYSLFDSITSDQNLVFTSKF